LRRHGRASLFGHQGRNCLVVIAMFISAVVMDASLEMKTRCQQDCIGRSWSQSTGYSIDFLAKLGNVWGTTWPEHVSVTNPAPNKYPLCYPITVELTAGNGSQRILAQNERVGFDDCTEGVFALWTDISSRATVSYLSDEFNLRRLIGQGVAHRKVLDCIDCGSRTGVFAADSKHPQSMRIIKEFSEVQIGYRCIQRLGGCFQSDLIKRQESTLYRFKRLAVDVIRVGHGSELTLHHSQLVTIDTGSNNSYAQDESPEYSLDKVDELGLFEFKFEPSSEGSYSLFYLVFGVILIPVGVVFFCAVLFFGLQTKRTDAAIVGLVLGVFCISSAIFLIHAWVDLVFGLGR
jgi:hypothetical protein